MQKPSAIKDFIFQITAVLLLIVSGVVIAGAQASVDYNHKFTPEQLIEDVDFYVKRLEEAHINPYANISAKEFRAHAENIKSEIRRRGGMTQKEFWLVLTPLIAGIQDSHTLVVEPRHFIKLENNPEKYLPIRTEYIDGKIVVTNSVADEKIEKGAIITAINGVPAKEIIRRMSAHISGSEAEKVHKAGGSIGLGAHDVLGFPEEFNLSFKGGRNVTVKAIRLAELIKRERAAAANQPAAASSGKSPLELKFLNQETAYLNSTTFEYDLEKYKALLADVFTQIKSAGVKNLIIDLRNNRGGNSQLGDALLDMFNSKPYRRWAYKWKRSVFYAEKMDRELQPPSELAKYLAARPGEILSSGFNTVTPGANPLRFNGRVYILSAKETFSSGLMFLGEIKGNTLAKIIGEETNEPACMFGEMQLFWLPNSRLRASLSVKSWEAPGGCEGTRGIVPDVIVKRRIADYLTGRDVILETALDLIKRDGKLR